MAARAASGRASGSADDPLGAAIEPTPEATAAQLPDADGAAWLRLCSAFAEVREPLLAALLTQWPPTTTAARLLRAVGVREGLDFARFALLSGDRMASELFASDAARDLLAGHAAHADIPPQAPGSGLFAWLLAMLAQDVGFPSPAGGTARLAEALVARAVASGVQVRTGDGVVAIEVGAGRASGVRTVSGRRIVARRAVLADTSAPALYDRLLPADAVPVGLRARLARFAWDPPTVKLNYRLAASLPWTAERARGAGVVHAGLGHAELGRWSAALDAGVPPERPFALVGQMTTIDPARSPAGTEALWLYTHAPRGRADEATAREVAGRAEAMLDALAPGWRDLVLDRWEQLPGDLADADANLEAGAVGGGTSQLFQQGPWRPVTGLGGPRTHLDRLYLASAAIHPGGGVHGGCGYLAARAALADHAWWGRPAKRLRLGALHRLYERPLRSADPRAGASRRFVCRLMLGYCS